MAGQSRPLIAGNWKMNGLTADLGEIAAIRDAAIAASAGSAELVICPPATLIAAAAALCAGSPVSIGGQDCDPRLPGAHTGDVSAAMLKDAGAAYVIIGHSERRHDHGETDTLVAAKAAAALTAGLKVILCVGETEAARAAGDALQTVAGQLERSLPKAISADRLVIAYEPVWAIGTGVTPTPDDVAEMHACLRGKLVAWLPRGGDVRILYGGSVKPGNAGELLHLPAVDGALVGGASLKAAEFLPIARAAGE